MGKFRDQLIPIVRERGLTSFPEPVQLASGAMSCDFIDGKRALAHGAHLAIACHALIELAAERGIRFDAVGGLTMGADAFAHGIALLAECDWFSVRKEAKGRGTNRLIEGSELTESSRVLLVDDVVTTGGSMLQAYDVITKETRAKVVAAVTLVDRSDLLAVRFEALGVPYKPLVTYDDLGIAPVRNDGLVTA